MTLTTVLRAVASALKLPVIAILIILAVVTVVILGMLIAEVFTERRKFSPALSQLIDDIQSAPNPEICVANSGLLKQQKADLLEMLSHPSASPQVRETLAVNLVAKQQARFDNRIKVTDYISKVAPMLGLMGTLIPLGPGLIGIGEGNVEILSSSLLVAFDTTVLGLAIAAVALFISVIRKSWYAKYMNDFEAAAEVVLDRAATDSCTLN